MPVNRCWRRTWPSDGQHTYILRVICAILKYDGCLFALTTNVPESRDKLESAASRNKIHLRYVPAVAVGNRDEPMEIKLLFIG